MSARPPRAAPQRSFLPSRTMLRRGVVVAIATSGLLLTWAIEHGSVERANRLHRRGALEEASAIYAREAAAEPDASLRYNLGTSLLGLGDESARAELERAARDDVAPEIRARALYNHGVSSLRDALAGEAGDSLRAHAVAAVATNRAALRLRPEHADTRWNLAIAQRLLDSIDASDRRSGRELEEGAVEADLVVRSENARDVEENDELPDEAPREGEDETRADAPGEGALSLAEAEEILGSSHLDGRAIVQKLLALEGRSVWGRRLRRTLLPRR